MDWLFEKIVEKIVEKEVPVRDTVYLMPHFLNNLQENKQDTSATVTPVKQQEPELLSGHKESRRDVNTKRGLNENQTRTVEVEEKKEDTSVTKGRDLTKNEKNAFLNKYITTKTAKNKD